MTHRGAHSITRGDCRPREDHGRQWAAALNATSLLQEQYPCTRRATRCQVSRSCGGETGCTAMSPRRRARVADGDGGEPTPFDGAGVSSAERTEQVGPTPTAANRWLSARVLSPVSAICADLSLHGRPAGRTCPGAVMKTCAASRLWRPIDRSRRWRDRGDRHFDRPPEMLEVSVIGVMFSDTVEATRGWRTALGGHGSEVKAACYSRTLSGDLGADFAGSARVGVC